ncbi:hypothetical protein [Dendronalium sp. ChiSLP03b]|uniref:hypothetical protein n=1 Tax=Dendronalium sp. ChiSLP03b TaxID=3075381 RepID=UPI002AD3FAC4|nr:hypothetical protein [Dendronalium sp. ChiSLP03b]MDZ8206133.1 hypothetical protein [Dendronalium sp. ChiSLP03b]
MNRQDWYVILPLESLISWFDVRGFVKEDSDNDWCYEAYLDSADECYDTKHGIENGTKHGRTLVTASSIR